nr:hypothetical protein [Tanacetum cinerariifolium]
MIDENYHSIKDDILLVNVYTTGNVLVRGMLIPDAFLTEKIHATDDFKEYEMVFGREVDEKKDDEMGSLEIRTKEMQTSIPITHRSPRKNLSLDKNIDQEMTDADLILSATTSKDPHLKRRISKKYSHIPGVLRRMYMRQGYMIKNMERKYVTTDYFWKIARKIDQVLHDIVPQLAEKPQMT